MKKMVMILALLPMVVGAQTGIRSLFPNTPTPFVTDAAGILKPSDIVALNDKARGVQGATGGDIAVATLSTIGDYQPYEVALEIGRVWKVGGKAEIGADKRNLGVVILLVPRTKEHKGTCFIATGNGAEGVITDAKAGDICRDAVPQLKAGDYAGGLMTMMNKIGPIFESTVHPAPPPPPAKPIDWGFVGVILFILGAIGSFIGVVVYLNNKAKERVRRAEEERERKYRAVQQAKWDAEQRERDRIAAIEKKKRDAAEAERRRVATEKEAARWAALTPKQQAAELEARRIAETEAAAAALIAAEIERKRRKKEEAAAKKRRQEEEEEDRQRRSRSSSYYGSSDYGSSSSGDSSSGGSSDSFGGGGGFSGGGGGSDF